VGGWLKRGVTRCDIALKKTGKEGFGEIFQKKRRDQPVFDQDYMVL
jgi:hypothetical protein